MLYAILTPDRDAPWGYYACEHVPTLEELADHMAEQDDLPSRDDWLEINRVGYLAFAPVH